MNGSECDGTDIFMKSRKYGCSIQRGEAKVNRTFHLSPSENIFTRSNEKHSFFVL